MLKNGSWQYCFGPYTPTELFEYNIWSKLKSMCWFVIPMLKRKKSCSKRLVKLGGLWLCEQEPWETCEHKAASTSLMIGSHCIDFYFNSRSGELLILIARCRNTWIVDGFLITYPVMLKYSWKCVLVNLPCNVEMLCSNDILNR